MELQHFSHEHTLSLIDHEDDSKRCRCCKDPVSGLAFSCRECDSFHLHKKCAELPREIKHPLHRKHILTLRKDWPPSYNGYLDFNRSPYEEYYPECSSCLTSSKSHFIYHCSDCQFCLDIKCAFLPRCLVGPDQSVHHQYALFNKRGTFTCDVCGRETGLSPYICSICHIVVHKDCRSLPRTINVLQHHHPVTLSYFLTDKELTVASNCVICHEQVDKEVWSYSCLSFDGGCNFLAHVGCALEQNVIGGEEKDVESIFSVSKINYELIKDQLPIEIEHFSHEHKLLLGDDDEIKEKMCCDGCIQPISTPFYRCVDCDFNLHKTCAELPSEVKHLFHQHPLILQLPKELDENGIVRCQVCFRQSHGFLYWCWRCQFVVDVLCISVPYKFKHNGHEHPLVFTVKHFQQPRLTCSACGDDCFRSVRKYLLQCNDCPFVLDYQCGTLPQTVKHRYDDHPFLLTYQPVDDGYDEYYCDICEEERNPKNWFYYCPKCDHSAHTECALGKYPYLKLGKTYMEKYKHPHPLTFVQRDRNYLPCACCDENCKGLSFECSDSGCGYSIHKACFLLD